MAHPAEDDRRSDLLDDIRFCNSGSRFERKEEVVEIISSLDVEPGQRTAMGCLTRRRSGGSVFDTGDLMNDPSFRATGMLTEIIHPTRGPVVLLLAGQDERSPTPPISCPPTLGQHTDTILHDLPRTA